MPQLEFTIWLSNALINWVVLIVFILFLNSKISTWTLCNLTAHNSRVTNINNNWPW